MKRILRAVSLLLALLVPFAVSSCGRTSATKADRKVALTVAGHDVSKATVEYFETQYKREVLSDGIGETLSDSEKDALDKAIKNATEESLRKIFAVYELASERGITPDSVATELDGITENFITSQYGGDEEAFYSDLEAEGMSYGTFLFFKEHELLQNALYSSMISDGTLPYGEEMLKDRFLSGELVRVKHVMVSYEAENGAFLRFVDPEAAAADPALEKAEKVLSLAGEGEDFDSLVEKYGDEVLLRGNSDGFYFTKGNKELSYEEAAFALEAGQISDIVTTSAGFCIIKRLELDESYVEKNLSSLMDSFTEGLFNLFAEERAESLEVIWKQ